MSGFKAWCAIPLIAWVAAAAPPTAAETGALDYERLAALREVGEVRLSPDGAQIAFTLEVPRRVDEDEDGPEWTELWVVPSDGGTPRPWVHGPVHVSQPRFSPDGRWIGYVAKRGDDETKALWAIPLGGGESRRLVIFDTDVEQYRWAPDGGRVAFVAVEPEETSRKEARERGHSQEVFEEDWRPRRLWIAPVDLSPAPPAPAGDPAEPKPLDVEGSVFDLEWTPDGSRLVLAVAPSPLIDDRYMARRIAIHDVETGRRLARLANPGKLGSFRVSPDGRSLALITADDPNDPQEGRLKVASLEGGALRELLPGLVESHATDLAWVDADTVAFLADVGVETLFGEVDLDGGEARRHLVSGEGGAPVLTALAASRDGRRFAFVGEHASHPRELFSWSRGAAAAERRTRSNPGLDDVRLARQQVLRWRARDGLELEGILLPPLDPPAEGAPPLMLIVHGGPEAHIRNGWVTSYSRPGQLAAGRGWAVFYPNYRGSTGRGVAFSKLGQRDAAGAEFDDLLDAVDHLAAAGLADAARVGITGGSYGGYATAWCATRHTERFRAGVMFVGISNKLSKGLTTEIPNEDRMVHTLFDPWTNLQFSLERSPLYHAERSRTALLIAGGTADTRVHPSQSLQLYRALKLIGKTPVRYVRYPGEGHGNRRAAARDDYARRLMRWMEHFVVDGATELPPWELPRPTAEDDAGS